MTPWRGVDLPIPSVPSRSLLLARGNVFLRPPGADGPEFEEALTPRNPEWNHVTEEGLIVKLFGGKFRNKLTHKQKIFFFGHFGLGNFGNESTLQAILYHVRRLLPDAELRCICTGPEATATTHDIIALPVSRAVLNAWNPHNQVAKLIRSIFVGAPSEVYRWFEGLITLKDADVLIVAGTGLVSDAYGLRGWGPYSLFKWSLLRENAWLQIALRKALALGPYTGTSAGF